MLSEAGAALLQVVLGVIAGMIIGSLLDRVFRVRTEATRARTIAVLFVQTITTGMVIWFSILIANQMDLFVRSSMEGHIGVVIFSITLFAFQTTLGQRLTWLQTHRALK